MDTVTRRIEDAIAEQAAAWFVACRSGELSTAEREAFVQWLRRSPQHAAEYLELCAMAEDLPGAAGRVQEPLEQVLSDAHAGSLESTVFVSSPPEGMRGRFLSRRPWAIAAALFVVALGCVFWLQLSPPSTRHATTHGEQRTLQLPDMSVLRLNSDSAVEFDFDPRRREIRLLRGQAYFEVARDPHRPFTVSTHSATVTALGTAFDVYEQTGGVVVTVTEGRVAVAGKARASMKSPAMLELSAGEQTRVSATGMAPVHKPDLPRVTAWTRQEIAFKNEPVAQVAGEFNRYNRLAIEVRDPAVAGTRISGVFQSYDVASFLDFLEQLPGVRVQRAGVRAIVAPDP